MLVLAVFITLLNAHPGLECLAQIGQEAGERSTSEHSSFKQILRLKAVHYLAFFVLVYVGVEVTIGGGFFPSQIVHNCPLKVVRFLGWVVTFMRDVRGGGLSSGYVSSGFFGGTIICITGISSHPEYPSLSGLMLGRVLLLWVNEKVGNSSHLSDFILIRLEDRRAARFVCLCPSCYRVT